VHSVSVLWYLWSKQFVNGIKRAVSTPRRLISILIGIGYYVGFFIRPWDSKGSSSFEQLGKSFQFEPKSVEPIVFIIFSVVSILSASTIFGFKNTFKQSDVDVLFPLPIPSKVVMFFRLLRDYAVTLFIPIVFGIAMFQPTKGILSGVSKNDPFAIQHLIQGGLIAWLLLMLAWVSISYAMCFWVAKNETKSQVIIRSVGWALFLITILFFGSIGLQFRANPIFATIQSATSAPWLKGLMIIPSSATAIVMGGFSPSPVGSLLGVGILVTVIWISLSFAASLSGWMYDQAATKGFQGQAMRDLQRKGDYAGIFADRARRGKIGRGRIAKRVAEWNFRRGWTLIYKEILIQARIGFWSNLIFLLIIGGFGVMFLFIPETNGVQIGAYMYLGLTGFMGVNMSSIQSYTGFVETLRRVEVMKPLPLTSAQIAFFETAAKAVVAMFMSGSPFLIGLIYKPSLWHFHLAGMIAAPSLSLALTSAVFLIVVLFPDFDDPTQRTFRGIMQLIALVIIMVPTALIFVGLMLIGWSPLVPGLICLGVNFGITVLLTSITGRFYADFNPSE
jgi:hypothetical protein